MADDQWTIAPKVVAELWRFPGVPLFYYKFQGGGFAYAGSLDSGAYTLLETVLFPGDPVREVLATKERRMVRVPNGNGHK